MYQVLEDIKSGEAQWSWQSPPSSPSSSLGSRKSSVCSISSLNSSSSSSTHSPSHHARTRSVSQVSFQHSRLPFGRTKHLSRSTCQYYKHSNLILTNCYLHLFSFSWLKFIQFFFSLNKNLNSSPFHVEVKILDSSIRTILQILCNIGILTNCITIVMQYQLNTGIHLHIFSILNFLVISSSISFTLSSIIDNVIIYMFLMYKCSLSYFFILFPQKYYT